MQLVRGRGFLLALRLFGAIFEVAAEVAGENYAADRIIAKTVSDRRRNDAGLFLRTPREIDRVCTAGARRQQLSDRSLRLRRLRRER